MAEDVVIRAEGLGKKYLIGHTTELGWHFTFRDKLVRSGHDFWRKAMDVARGRAIVAGDTIEEFWALKDVTFEVKRGEVLGVIGRNGAGKSTLLKILSRITQPTEGRVTIKGRVASLLEVGTGFHPELTGRENIYLNGAILGMARVEINRKFDEIVAFAEVEKLLDTPVKRYSSGMYVRLAFAVAAHLEPEILIVDEVLAVGDAEFQKKCLGKMDDVSRREGRTVLFVSHNMGVVTTLCPRVIWLHHGSAKRDGSARAVIDDYLQRAVPDTNPMIEMRNTMRPSFIHDQRLRLQSLQWLSNLPLRHGGSAKARIHFETYTSVPGVSIGISFCARESARLLTYYTDFQNGFRPDLAPGAHTVEVMIDALPLGPEIYELEVGCRSAEFHVLDYLPACALVEVVAGPNTPGYIIAKDTGVRLSSEWSWDFNSRSTEVRPIEEVSAPQHRIIAIT